MKLLVKKSDKIDVVVYVYEESDKINATHEKEEIPKGTNPVEFVFTFRKPTYQDSTNILASAAASTTGDDMKIDPTKFQTQILKTLLVGWNLTDEDGDVEFNQINLNSLDPVLARAAFAGILTKIRL